MAFNYHTRTQLVIRQIILIDYKQPLHFYRETKTWSCKLLKYQTWPPSYLIPIITEINSIEIG